MPASGRPPPNDFRWGPLLKPSAVYVRRAWQVAALLVVLRVQQRPGVCHPIKKRSDPADWLKSRMIQPGEAERTEWMSMDNDSGNRFQHYVAGQVNRETFLCGNL